MRILLTDAHHLNKPPRESGCYAFPPSLAVGIGIESLGGK